VTDIKRSTKPFASTSKNPDRAYDIRVGAEVNKEQTEVNPVEKFAVEQAKKPPSGSTSSNEKVNVTECEGKNGDALTKCRKSIREAMAKKEKSELSDCSASFFMVPYVVGIKPFDFVLFPSLKGDYIEDWEVDSVSYKQQGSAIIISVRGKRPQPGKGNLLDESSLRTFEEKISNLKTLRDWHRLYWASK
jgi:hypothetical protein